MAQAGEPSETIKTIGIIGSLVFAGCAFVLNAYATWRGVLSRRLLNYQEIVKSHREIWKLTLEAPNKYARVLEVNPDLATKPVTYEERRFVSLLLLHVTSAFSFSQHSDTVQISKIKEDIDEFLGLPIPRGVWLSERRFFNEDFVAFVEAPRRDLMAVSDDQPWMNLSYATRWKILVLTAFPERLARPLSSQGDMLLFGTETLGDITPDFLDANEINLIVCFGYGRILKKEVLDRVVAINVHCGFLPFDRGPNPNLWSCIRGSPRGVSLHFLDGGIDTGDLIAQRLVPWREGPMTLQSSFDQMIEEGVRLLGDSWPDFRAGRAPRMRQIGPGSRHTFKDQAPLSSLLTEAGLNLPLEEFCSRARLLLEEARAQALTAAETTGV